MSRQSVNQRASGQGSPSPSISQQAPTSDSGQPNEFERPPTLCKADEYMLKAIPSRKPMTEAELKALLRDVFDATDENMDEQLKNFDALVEQTMKEREIRAIGVKPRPEEGNFYLVNIPDSSLAIRMWDGGMDLYRQFCLDFYDTTRRISVNLPDGFSLSMASATMPGMPMMAVHGMPAMSVPLVSWETAFGFGPANIPAGEEKWSVPEGAYITLNRVGKPSLTLMAPVRYAQQAAIVQPTFVPAA